MPLLFVFDLLDLQHSSTLIAKRIIILHISCHVREEYNKQEEGGGVMPKFIPRKYEKEVISMRISVETLEELDTKANEIGISRNELITQCICLALAILEDSNGK